MFKDTVFHSTSDYNNACRFIEEALERYENNLCLLELVQDPLGTVARNGTVGEEEILADHLQVDPPWINFNSPSDFVLKTTEKKVVTFWSRRGFEPIGSGRREKLWMRKSTIKQLENEGYKIAYDAAGRFFLMVFK